MTVASLDLVTKDWEMKLPVAPESIMDRNGIRELEGGANIDLLVHTSTCCSSSRRVEFANYYRRHSAGRQRCYMGRQGHKA